MTVAELCKALEDFPQDRQVMVYGITHTKCGFDDALFPVVEVMASQDDNDVPIVCIQGFEE
jgi:hypothetical protein